MNKQQSSSLTKKRGLSTLDFFSIGFGAIVGVGWAVSVNKWMGNSGGALPGAVGFLAAIIIMVPIALCYCELTPMLPVAGGGAAYAYKAFGPKMSMISGWAAFGAFVTVIPWEAIYVTDAFSYVFPGLRGGEPLYTLAGTDVYLGSIILGTVFSTILFLTNLRGMSLSAGIQKILCIFLVGAGVLAMIFSVANGSLSNLQPYYENVTNTANHHSFLTGVLSIIVTGAWFLCGFETIPQAIEDSDGDVKNVGKTVLLSVSLSCIFYALILFCLGNGMPWKEFIQLETPAAANMFTVEYSGSFIGSAMYFVVLIGCIAGLFTTWNGFMMASPRLLMSLARTNMVPAFLGKQNKHGVPVNSLILCYVLSLLGPFLGLGLIDPLTSFSAAGFLISWLITCMSLIRLRKTEPDMERPYRIPGGVGTAWFAVIVTAFLLILSFIPGMPSYLGKVAIILFFAWMALGAICYFATRSTRHSIPENVRTATLFAKMHQEQS